jgi:predicted nucleic acid-binding Zn ribbon protein
MRKRTTQPIKGVIQEYIEALGHQRKLKEVNIISSWEKLMGKMIARHTKNIYIKNKVLIVYLDSAVMRNELLMMREQIRTQINSHAGSEIVEKIIFR